VDLDSNKPSEKWATGFHVASGVLTLLGALCGAAWCLFSMRPAASNADQWTRAELQSSLRE